MTALGDRMKLYEAAHRHVLPRRTYAIIRLDGRAFHSYLRGAQRPYDETFMADMDTVTQQLCVEISGACLAYTQSDEISILATDFGAVDTEPWFGGVLAKILSVSASLATAVLNEQRPGKRALFDARAFTMSDAVEVANYFIWRQRDAVRNSVSMAAQAKFSPKQLHKVNANQMQDMLWTEHGINWNDYPNGCKRGRVATKEAGTKKVEWVARNGRLRSAEAWRTWWEIAGAPHFTAEPGSFLAGRIPPLPTTLAGWLVHYQYGPVWLCDGPYSPQHFGSDPLRLFPCTRVRLSNNNGLNYSTGGHDSNDPPAEHYCHPQATARNLFGMVLTIGPRSSAGESRGLLILRPQVRVLPGAPYFTSRIPGRTGVTSVLVDAFNAASTSPGRIGSSHA